MRIVGRAAQNPGIGLRACVVRPPVARKTMRPSELPWRLVREFERAFAFHDAVMDKFAIGYGRNVR